MWVKYIFVEMPTRSVGSGEGRGGRTDMVVVVVVVVVVAMTVVMAMAVMAMAVMALMMDDWWRHEAEKGR